MNGRSIPTISIHNLYPFPCKDKPPCPIASLFPNDTALEKLVCLAYRNIRKKWTMPLANWGTIAQQLAIKFGDRFKLL